MKLISTREDQTKMPPTGESPSVNPLTELDWKETMPRPQTKAE